MDRASPTLPKTWERMSLLSIVHEFAILYSSRVFQKHKKWCDGRLRYYELNNKLEVLSDDMFLVVADFYPHHLRNPIVSGTFADGSEYILPSGKLIIEISEYLGSYERDLSNVFAKKDAALQQEAGIKVEECPSEFHRKGPSTTPRIDVKYIKREPRPIATPTIKKELKSTPLTRRPIGLRRTPKKPENTEKQPGNPRNAEIQPDQPQQNRVKMTEKLDSFYNFTVRSKTRIPPGSNKLSRRLKFETGLFSAIKGNRNYKEEPIQNTLQPSVISRNIEKSGLSDDDLHDLLAVKQKYENPQL